MVGLMGIVTQSNRGHQYQVTSNSVWVWQLGTPFRASLLKTPATSTTFLAIRFIHLHFWWENDDKPPTLGVPHISDRSSSGFIFFHLPLLRNMILQRLSVRFLLFFLVVRLDPPEILFQRPTYSLLMVSHHELSCLTIQSQLRSIRISDGHMCISDHMFCILCRLFTWFFSLPMSFEGPNPILGKSIDTSHAPHLLKLCAVGSAKSGRFLRRCQGVNQNGEMMGNSWNSSSNGSICPMAGYGILRMLWFNRGIWLVNSPTTDKCSAVSPIMNLSFAGDEQTTRLW